MANRERLRRSNRIWVLVWAVVFAVIAIVIISAMGSSRRSDEGQTIGTVEIHSVTCESSDISYPFFTYTDVLTKNLRIVMTHSDGEMRSISLQYNLSYADTDKMIKSEAYNHAAMNLKYGEDNLEADAFNSVYAMMDKDLRFSLYALKEEIGTKGKKYFLIDKVDDYNIDRIQQEYGKLGLKCVKS